MITLDDLGFSMALPEGWDGRIFRSSSGATILQAGSFSLPEYDADLGFGAQETMPSDGIYINVADQGEPGEWLAPGVWEEVALPIQVGRNNLTMFEGSFVESLACRWAIVHGRCLLVHAALGLPPPSDRQIAVANAVLATLTVAPQPAVVR